MAVNYEEINQNLLRVIQNADNQGAFLQEFLGAPAKDVVFKNTAADGTVIERSVPNVTKFTQDVASSINKELTKTFFVDPLRGNDENDGLSTSTQLRSIAEAVKRCVGGSHEIALSPGEHVVDTIVYARSSIFFYPQDRSNPPTIRNIVNNDGSTSGFRCKNASIVFDRCNIVTTSAPTTNIWQGFIHRHDTGSYIVSFSNSNININSPLIKLPSGINGCAHITFYNVTFTQSTSRPAIELSYSSASIDFSLCRAVDGNGAPVELKQLIAHVVRDTNGVPRNINSNIII